MPVFWWDTAGFLSHAGTETRAISTTCRHPSLTHGMPFHNSQFYVYVSCVRVCMLVSVQLLPSNSSSIIIISCTLLQLGSCVSFLPAQRTWLLVYHLYHGLFFSTTAQLTMISEWKVFWSFLIISLQNLHLSVSLHFIFQFHVWFCFTFTHQIESESPAVTGLSPYLLVWSVLLHNVMTTKLNPARFRMTSGPSQNTPSQFTNPFLGNVTVPKDTETERKGLLQTGAGRTVYVDLADISLIKWFK